MADSMREQKLAAARKKLRQFQKKKGTKRVIEGSSKEGTPEVEGSVTEDSSPLSDSGTLSSHASSIDLASEEFIEISDDSTSKVDSTVSFHTQSHPQDLTNGESETNSAGVNPQVCIAGGNDAASQNESQYPTGPAEEGLEGVPSTSCAVINDTQMISDELEVSKVSSSPEVEIDEAFSAVSPSMPADIVQEHIADEKESNKQDGQISSLQPPAAEDEIPNHDSLELLMQSGSDITSTSTYLPQNEVAATLQNEGVTSTTLNQSSEMDLQTDNPATFQEIIPSVMKDLPEEQSDLEVLPNDFAVHEEQNSSDLFEREGSVSSETTASVTTAIHVSTVENQGNPVLKSSSESLRQISLQLSGLMNENEGTVSALPDPAISELERRNAELAALLQRESQTSQQRAQYITQLNTNIERLEAELNAAHGVLNSAAGGGAREVESLREQLQVHIQTIGILVSEKSELQSSLTHANHALKQKAGEVTELDGRLSASRQRVGELEASLKDVTSERDAVRLSLDSLSKDFDTTKMTNFKYNKHCEELKASVAELTERLSVKTSDHDKLYSQLTDTKSELAMAQLHVQQMRDGTNEEIQSQLEKVQAAHMESQKQLQATQLALSQAHAENSQVAAQYQQYTKQLAEQTQSLQEQVKQFMIEKETLETALEDTKAQLQTALQPSSTAMNEKEVIAERERLNQTVTALQEEKLQLKEQNAAMTNDNSQLSKLVDQLSHNVEELEIKVERSKTEEVDTSQLLAAMQSDKVAAARALSQNKQLKEQLEELQSGFIIMSNKKLELTEKLEKELHVKRSLNQEIAALNEELTNMKQQVVEKDREIAFLKENGESLSAQLTLNQSQSQDLEDRSQMLQDIEQLTKENASYATSLNELQEKLRLTQAEMHELTRQNLELRDLMEEFGSKTPRKGEETLNGNISEETSNEEDEGAGKLLAKVASLTASVSKLELEHNNLQSQLEGERAKNEKLLKEYSSTEEPSETLVSSETAGTAVSRMFSPEEFRSLQEAHKALEDRFSRSMQQVAELSDEKQHLEHVIQKLQVETETVGDYITIYQFQRGVMKQQARERELELSSLMHEREEMRIKLATLQELVSTLAQEKGPDHEQLIKMTNVIISQPCPTNDLAEKNGELEIVNGTVEEDIAEEASENLTDTLNSTTQPTTENNPSRIDTHGSTYSNHPDLTGDPPKKTTAAKSPTVQRILDLLNEMEATSQVEHCGLQKFHPCPLCSGKLITV
ncbi:golgin subfamily A member 2-like [Panulirus ornatus]|uniref:golgin subfamily A member 2-like n=1 Tax=Panulirus ornatus TaxID=150431 RepID=UPI003A8C47DD